MQMKETGNLGQQTEFKDMKDRWKKWVEEDGRGRAKRVGCGTQDMKSIRKENASDTNRTVLAILSQMNLESQDPIQDKAQASMQLLRP